MYEKSFRLITDKLENSALKKIEKRASYGPNVRLNDYTQHHKQIFVFLPYFY